MVVEEKRNRAWVARRRNPDPDTWSFLLISGGSGERTLNIIMGSKIGDDPDQYIDEAIEAALRRGACVHAPGGARKWREAAHLLDCSGGRPAYVFRPCGSAAAVGVFEVVRRGGEVTRTLIRTTAAGIASAAGVALRAGRVDDSLRGLRT